MTTAPQPGGDARAEQRQRVLRRYMSERGLKSTAQRDAIIDAFFRAGEHVAVGELHQALLKQNPQLGYATVYRTLKLLAECGLAAERHFGDGQTRYEPNDVGEHHDHLICRSCGRIEEFHNADIERLQDAVAAAHSFRVDAHRLEIYGQCRECQQPRSSPPG